MNYTLETIERIIKETNLNDNEKLVLIMRFKDNTLEEIGKKINLGRERIRQIERKGNRKLLVRFKFGNINIIGKHIRKILN